MLKARKPSRQTTPHPLNNRSLLAPNRARRETGAMNIGAIKTLIGQLGLVEEDGYITQLMWDARDKGERTPVL